MVEFGNQDLTRGVGRSHFVFLLMLLALCGLLSRLWHLQVVEQQSYLARGSRDSVRVVREPGLRGEILDRFGTPLAENQASHGIAIYMAEVRQDPKRPRKIIDAVEEVVDEIAVALDLPRTITRKQIETHFYGQRFLPLLAWKNLPEETIARYAEQIGSIPGVDIYSRAIRTYPFDDLACHIIGYVGRGNTRPDEPDEEQKRWYFLEDMKGREGIEWIHNDTLRGEPRERMIMVDVNGYKFENLGEDEPVESGSDIVLSLNHRIQWVAEDVLGEDIGAICVVDPANGDVLALASFPRYSLQTVSPRFPTAYHNQLKNDRGRPFGNKAVAERYAPGSTFKPFVALAALQSGEIAYDHTEFCNGRIELGGQDFGCTGRHGDISVTRALETSCNIYFYEVGRKIGYDRIREMGSELGMGKKTDIGLPESAGQLPTREAEEARTGYWAPGLTLQTAIGQGTLTTTPLQMALATATIANGGTLYRPRLIREIRPKDAPPQPVLPRAQATNLFRPAPLRLVREGMRRVVYGTSGTAHKARVEGLVYAGKTGTAQYGPVGNTKYRGWMIAFAPYDNPQVAISIVVESTADGSAAAAVKMKALIERLGPYLGREPQ